MSRERASEAGLADYNTFVQRTGEVFAGLQASRKTTAEEVAKVIHDAATDGANQLRYFVGEDTGDFIRSKREKSDQEHFDFMRSKFL
jgi:hypothetical protein